MKRARHSRILATLGPSSSSPDCIRELFEAGADVFRLNFSHGTQQDHAARFHAIRALEQETGRHIGILMDLQGPKLRIGALQDGKIKLTRGQRFRLDLQPMMGDQTRVHLPHPEIFAALIPGTELLLDDGKLRLRVEQCGHDFADTTVVVGGILSDRKGVNVPDVVLPISPLTEKDLDDLQFGLDLGVDWVALSFVQRPEDIREARSLIGNQAWIMAKLEKPQALEHLEEIIELSDGVMVARGDLGVEVPPQKVPVLQRQIVRAARAAGRPVVVATQMLESMISSPVPTRAEASDVATAIYSGADAVMLSAESAVGQFPVAAVSFMDHLISEVEADPNWRIELEASHSTAEATTPDAICCALRRVAGILQPATTVAYTTTGFSALRASRERPVAPILALTPKLQTARRLSLAWGVHAVAGEHVRDVSQMVQHATHVAHLHGFAQAGDTIVIIAGVPFGTSGSTNLLHVAHIADDN